MPVNKLDVMVVCREEAEGAVFGADHAVISIYTPSDSPAQIRHPIPNQVLPIAFSDLRYEHVSLAPIPFYPAKVFTEDQANEIYAFVDKMLDQGVNHFLVHCDAGISRSPAVAVALRMVYNNDDGIPYRYRMFNPLVLDLMLKAKGITLVKEEKGEQTTGGTE